MSLLAYRQLSREFVIIQTGLQGSSARAVVYETQRRKHVVVKLDRRITVLPVQVMAEQSAIENNGQFPNCQS